METATTSKELLELAIGFEETAATFYEALALASDDRQVAAFCAAAARDEARHRLTFARILREVAGVAAPRRASNRALSRGSKATIELTAAAKRSIQPGPAVVRGVAIGGDRKAALTMAIRMERDAIRFYHGLLATLPESAPIIREIITEEERHLGALRSITL